MVAPQVVSEPMINWSGDLRMYCHLTSLFSFPNYKLLIIVERGMSKKFSTALRIGDLNDFITLSQACIVLLKSLKANTNKPDSEIIVGKSKQVQSEPIKISLKDCLASSLNEFLSNINKGKAVIMSVFLQSRTSLAAHFNIFSLQMML
ncbi:hypothetical protein Ahy_B06g081710 [Arachis hypogaea]|uniref:Uncharacterized protein n=1 Tax=Arachis hypogaea TaxID=3818 RepID=A0A444YLS9_ARAHY|nr:hypothetical protein Ahy_B06g081710 [Arachis hypogaea]